MGMKLPWDDPNADVLGDIRAIHEIEGIRGEGWKRQMGRNRQCVALDFDGVIHKYDKGWQEGAIYDEIDVTGITMCQAQGFAVAIMTSRDVYQVLDVLKAELPEARFVPDSHCTNHFWLGGKDGKDILITNHKIGAAAYIDDRAVNHQFGDSWPHTILKVLQTVEERRYVKPVDKRQA